MKTKRKGDIYGNIFWLIASLFILLILTLLISTSSIIKPYKILPDKCIISKVFICTNISVYQNSISVTLKNAFYKDLEISSIKLDVCEDNLKTFIPSGSIRSFVFKRCNINQFVKSNITIYYKESQIQHLTTGEMYYSLK